MSGNVSTTHHRTVDLTRIGAGFVEGPVDLRGQARFTARLVPFGSISAAGAVGEFVAGYGPVAGAGSETGVSLPVSTSVTFAAAGGGSSIVESEVVSDVDCAGRGWLGFSVSTVATAASGEGGEGAMARVEITTTPDAGISGLGGDSVRVFEVSYAQASGSALGTGDAARRVALTQRKVVSAGLVMDAADTGTITVRILNSSGATQHTATLSVSAALTVPATALSWDSGDGTIEAGEVLEVERTSGFSTATDLNAVIRLEEAI